MRALSQCGGDEVAQQGAACSETHMNFTKEGIHRCARSHWRASSLCSGASLCLPISRGSGKDAEWAPLISNRPGELRAPLMRQHRRRCAAPPRAFKDKRHAVCTAGHPAGERENEAVRAEVHHAIRNATNRCQARGKGNTHGCRAKRACCRKA